jgi:hypothetical protein
MVPKSTWLAIPTLPEEHHAQRDTTCPCRQVLPEIVVGLDTHPDTNVLAVVTTGGRCLATAAFPTTTAGIAAAMEWADSAGAVTSWAIEGTGSYGAGLTRALLAAGHRVVEVSQPPGQKVPHNVEDDTDPPTPESTTSPPAVPPERQKQPGSTHAEAIFYCNPELPGAVQEERAFRQHLGGVPGGGGSQYRSTDLGVGDYAKPFWTIEVNACLPGSTCLGCSPGRSSWGLPRIKARRVHHPRSADRAGC